MQIWVLTSAKAPTIRRGQNSKFVMDRGIIKKENNMNTGSSAINKKFFLTETALQNLATPVTQGNFKGFDYFFDHFPPSIVCENPVVRTNFLQLVERRAANDESRYHRMLLVFRRHLGLPHDLPIEQFKESVTLLSYHEETEDETTSVSVSKGLLSLLFNYFRGKELPEQVVLNLSPGALHALEDYLYTGKLDISSYTIFKEFFAFSQEVTEPEFHEKLTAHFLGYALHPEIVKSSNKETKDIIMQRFADGNFYSFICKDTSNESIALKAYAFILSTQEISKGLIIQIFRFHFAEKLLNNVYILNFFLDQFYLRLLQTENLTKFHLFKELIRFSNHTGSSQLKQNVVDSLFDHLLQKIKNKENLTREELIFLEKKYISFTQNYLKMFFPSVCINCISIENFVSIFDNGAENPQILEIVARSISELKNPSSLNNGQPTTLPASLKLIPVKYRRAIVSINGYEKYTNLDRLFPNSNLSLESFIQQLGNLPTENLEQELENNSNNPMLHIKRGFMYQLGNELDKAEACYRKALAINRKLVPALFLLSQILTERNKNEEAKQCLLKALRYNPKELGVYLLYLRICLEENHDKEALRIIKLLRQYKYNTYHPDVRKAMQRKAENYAENLKWHKAKQFAVNALHLAEIQFITLHQLLGEIYFNLKDYRLAEEYLKSKIPQETEDNTQIRERRLTLSEFLFITGDLKRLKFFATKEFTENKNCDKKSAATASAFIGKCHTNPATKRKHYNRAIDLDKNNFWANLFLGDYFLESKNPKPKKAIDSYIKALEALSTINTWSNNPQVLFEQTTSFKAQVSEKDHLKCSKINEILKSLEKLVTKKTIPSTQIVEINATRKRKKPSESAKGKEKVDSKYAKHKNKEKETEQTGK